MVENDYDKLDKLDWATIIAFVLGIMLILGAFGCKPTTVYVDRPIEVRIMVPVPCPEPPKVPRPVLAPLPPNPTDQQVAEAALRSLLAVQGYAASLETLLDAYRPEKKP